MKRLHALRKYTVNDILWLFTWTVTSISISPTTHRASMRWSPPLATPGNSYSWGMIY